MNSQPHEGSSCFILWRYSLYADVVLFFFSFFSKTLARARELAVDKSPPVYNFTTRVRRTLKRKLIEGVAIVQEPASARVMTSHLAAVSIETHTARLETEPSHLPNLYISLVGKECDDRIITGQVIVIYECF